MFGSAAASHLNSSGCSSRLGGSTKPSPTDAAMTETRDSAVSQIKAQCLFPPGCLPALLSGHCTVHLLSEYLCSVVGPRSFLSITSDSVEYIVHNLCLQGAEMKGLQNECNYEI